MPAVSVLMVFHRKTPFLRPAVQSMLDQTFRDFELLLVDNGTGCGLGLLGAEGRDPRIRLITLPANLGISAGRNAALAEARGEFVALLDDDDIALPTRLEKQVALLRSDAHLGLVSSRADRIDEEGQVVGREFALLEERSQLVFSNYTMPAPAPSYTGRREWFERFPFRPAFDHAEDFDFVARVAEVSAVRGAPEILLHYRQHAGQVTRTHAAEQIRRACAVRLITARRRHGRPENLPDALARIADGGGPMPPLVEVYADFAHQCLREGFPLLAVYHARKMVAVRRDGPTVLRALRLLAVALFRARGEAGTVLRMFLTGPLRTHDLHPA
jgi:GT2 family glycosyltransferase